MTAKPTHYLATVGMNLGPDEIRYEAGDTVPASDVPKESLKWLVDDGHLVAPDMKKGA